MMDHEHIVRPEFDSLAGMVQDHHKRIRDIEKTLEHTPDPKTLREIEHTHKELPPTDDIKGCIKDHIDRKANIRRWIWGIIAVVSSFVVIAAIRLFWEGVGRAIVSAGGGS